jgi:hypothetical protein
MWLLVDQVNVHANIYQRRQKASRTDFQVLACGVRIDTTDDNIRLAERVGSQLPLDSIRIDLCSGINAENESACNICKILAALEVTST